MLAEWHLAPDYILANWTDEMLALMIEKLIERKQREMEAMRGGSRGSPNMPDEQFFKMAGIEHKVENGN